MIFATPDIVVGGIVSLPVLYTPLIDSVTVGDPLISVQKQPRVCRKSLIHESMANESASMFAFW